MERKFKKKVGQKLHLLRVEKKLTQEEMAEQLHLSTSAYCKIEYGETDLTLTRLNKIAAIFGVSPTELFKSIVEETTPDANSMPVSTDTIALSGQTDNQEQHELLYMHSQMLASLNKRITDLEKMQGIK